jgi:hypothetical protein
MTWYTDVDVLNIPEIKKLRNRKIIKSTQGKNVFIFRATALSMLPACSE